MAFDIDSVAQRFDELKQRNQERDHRHFQVMAARRGDVDTLMPGIFPRNWPRLITANIVDVAARDLGEMLGALPSIDCRPRKATNAAKKAAEKRTRIAIDYTERSRLQSQMYSGADGFVTFGALPIVVEPDFESMSPVLRVDSPIGAYYDLDLHGKVKTYFKRWYETVGALVAKFPDLETQIRRLRSGTELADSTEVEVVKHYGSHSVTVFLPRDSALILRQAPNPLGRVPVSVAERPRWDDEARGQFDEMLWVQMARARMALYSMEAAARAIQAPIQLPPDVTKMPTGPDAVVRTNSQVPIQRVKLDVPREVFVENELLQHEERLAARYPEGRTGNLDASVVTGRGVQELLGTMDTQLKTYQELLGLALAESLSIAMEMDETFWPDVTKVISGIDRGAPFSEEYTPRKDIDGDFAVDTTYGFAAGMDPNRALVFMLQLHGAGMSARETVMRQLPYELDVMKELERIDIEQLNEALKQGMFGFAASFAEMAATGMNPQDQLRKMATVIEQRQKGKTLHEAIIKAFEPTEEELAAEEQAAQDPFQQLLAGGQQAQGQGAGAAAPQGGRPPLQMLLAGLTSAGNPNLRADVSRQLPAAA